MLEMLPDNQAQWKAEQRLNSARMAAERDRMAAVRDRWAADRAEPKEHGTIVPRPNIYNMVDHIWYYASAKDLVQFLDALCLNCNSHGHLFPQGGPNHDKYAICLLEASSDHQNPAP